MAGSCEHGNESPRSMKYEEFLELADQLLAS
jgi:hypothetical protein